MDIETLKKEIRFRARRGMKETDLLLAQFLGSHLDALPPEELIPLRDLLLNVYDQDLMAWFFDGVTPPRAYAHTVALIKKHTIL